MPNHFHAIWQLHDGLKPSDFQRDLLKFTARSILKFMKMHDDPILSSLIVNDSDREYQVWERDSLSVELYSEPFFIEKFNYVHENPIREKWNLSSSPELYKYSSASFYETGVDEFGILTDWRC